MDTKEIKKINNAIKITDKVHVDELHSLLEQYPYIETLSLDCFDTLLWRKTMAPHDVFYDLQNKPSFQSLDFSATLRIYAEGKARQLAIFNQNNKEVNLANIYSESFPELDHHQLMDLIEEELAVEIETCYVFPPMLELIKQAYQRGLKIIIVSDTYFTESQLRRLLASALPQEIIAMIDKVFCSCEFGCSKGTGLFPIVIEKLNTSAETILHIGDNAIADFVSPKALNLNARHFIQQNETTQGLQSLYAISAGIIDPLIRKNYSMPRPFRGVLATKSLSEQKPVSLIGYATLGPILYAFSNFICQEVQRLKDAGKKTKVVFLLRDGYLPAKACEALTGEAMGKTIHISRFASYAASFRKKEDIDRYLVDVGRTNRFYDLAKQLLLPESMAVALAEAAQKNNDPISEFVRLIHQDEILQIIINNSKAYFERLLRHLHNETGLSSGDTLVLVDLGYYGTTQSRLSPIFGELGIDVVGCYLISLSMPSKKGVRHGLLDSSWCDEKAMRTLIFYIIFLEQLCTSNENSVIDYDSQGNPIYAKTGMKSQQHKKLIEIQNECIRFIKDAKLFFQQSNTVISMDMLKRSAMAELVRLLFFPTHPELDYVKDFQAEMNLGTTDIMRLFDAEQGLIGLRKRGTLYMEKPSKLTRTNYPAELRVAGIEFVLSLITQHRFNLSISMNDMMLRKEQLHLVFMQGQEMHATSVDAIATHDGFFSAWIPTRLQVALVFGKKYKWVQIDSIELIAMDAFIQQAEAQNTIDAWNRVEAYEMNERDAHEKNGKLFECASDSSALMFMASNAPQDLETVCRVVFRPIMPRN